MTDSAHVVIVGAGFAGLSAVGALRKAGLNVTVIDRNLYSTFQPLLYQVATGGLNPGDMAYPVGGFTGKRRARYIRGDLAAVDAAARVIRLAGGREIGYDYLILATGRVGELLRRQRGRREHLRPLHPRRRDRAPRPHHERLRVAERGPGRQREFAVTVVGGGATGVELAGTLGELRNDVLRATFPDVDPGRMHIRLVETAPGAADAVPSQAPRVRQAAARRPWHRHQGEHHHPRGDRGPGAARDGTWHRSDLTVWTGGVAAPEPVSAWGLPQGKAGRLLVGPDLRVQGTDRIFAAGDIALDKGNPSPQLAQPALQEGRHAAAQVIHLLRGEPTESFRYHDKGIMATIGRNSAVVQLARGARITGTFAWFAWLGLHLLYLLGNRNRIATLINLSWRYIAWGHGGGVIVGDEPTEPLNPSASSTRARRPVSGPGRPDPVLAAARTTTTRRSAGRGRCSNLVTVANPTCEGSHDGTARGGCTAWRLRPWRWPGARRPRRPERLPGCPRPARRAPRRSRTPTSTWAPRSSSQPAPDIKLVNQFGQPMSLSQFRGRVVLLGFEDSECTTVCPLTTQSMVLAKELLGTAGKSVQLLGVDANPAAVKVSRRARLLPRARHGQPVGLPDRVAPPSSRRYGRPTTSRSRSSQGQIDHTPALYMIDQQGREQKLYLTQMAYSSITQSAQVLATEISSLLPGHPKLSSHGSLASVPGQTPSATVTLRPPPRAAGRPGRAGPAERRRHRDARARPGPPRRLLRHLAERDLRPEYRTGRPQRVRQGRRGQAPPRAHRRRRDRHRGFGRGGDSYLHQLGPLSYPVALDETGRLADGYGVQDQPWLVLVNAAGKITWQHDGWVPLATLEQAAAHG